MARRNAKDPTGQGRTRKRMKQRTNGRLASAERAVKARFRAIPRTRRTVAPVVNADDIVVYDYQLSPEELAALSAEIQATLDEELETGAERVPPDWYAKPELEQAHRSGTLEEFVKLNALIAGAVLAGVLVRGMEPQQVTPERVLGSRRYRDALNNVYVSGFAAIKSLSRRTSDQVFQRINAGIKGRKTPTEIAADISERFGVARSNAERIANTEVNQAYNNAKFDATRIATEESGVEFGVTHISALLPTTRDNHAARHGLDYSVEDQEAWWDSGANRINCHCTTEPVRLDEDRRAVHSDVERRRLEGERAELREQLAPRPVKPTERTRGEVRQMKKAVPVAPDRVEKIKKTETPVTVTPGKLTETEKAPKIPRKVGLTGDESAYLDYYKGDGFYKSNEILRNPSGFSPNDVQSAERMRDSINGAVLKSRIREDGVLYRGVKSSDIFDQAEDLIGKDIPILTPQSTANNAGSATGWAGLLGDPKSGFISANPGQSVVFKIRTKKGQHALDMESLSIGATGEREILLGSGGRYKVRAVRDLKGSDGSVQGKVIEVDYAEGD